METKVNQDLPWNAFYVYYKFEKKVYNELTKLGIEAFLPLYTRLRLYKNRKRKSKIPLISCYVFAKVPVKYRGEACGIKGVVKFVKTGNQPSIIPNDEIYILKKLSEFQDNNGIETEYYFEIGQAVMVKYGPLTGIIGELFKVKGKNRVLVKIHSLCQALSVEIDVCLLEPINQAILQGSV